MVRVIIESMNSLPTKHAPTQEDLQVEALRALQAEIPLNDFGLPTGIYRTDLLPFHDYHPESRSKSSLIILDDTTDQPVTDEQ